MFTVMEKASDEIKDFFKNNDGPKTVRLLMQSGCCGTSLGMSLDEPQENDLAFTEHGVNFAIDKDLFEKVKPVMIDFVVAAEKSGFKITSNLTAGEGCGGSCCG